MHMYSHEYGHEGELTTSFIIAMIISLLFYIGFLGLLQRTLNCVAKERRTISPWLVWVMLIPFLNLILQFFIVAEISDSLRAEFTHRKSEIKEDRPGYDIGLLM